MGSGQGHSVQAIKLFQAPRKISFTFHFSHKSFILDETCTVIQQHLNERMWHFRGILWLLLHIFRGQYPNSQDLCPARLLPDDAGELVRYSDVLRRHVVGIYQRRSDTRISVGLTDAFSDFIGRHSPQRQRTSVLTDSARSLSPKPRFYTNFDVCRLTRQTST